ncbi:amidohydrolase [Modicisalibacter tunisiensis]|uniref:Amidohydrolase n=1 Tax=Modicisalibacter tunisiensis TaxID=390637 RepID=A0ABS7X1U9_9GAMM|nr:amidohydrolase [Modicisalibacter tunisiensis]MBZ9538229.1 amidohydrolase [Modicisalibacter tunisiensis]MBZ9568359.1 amidohydrolase [Modicisalibacter tunisiensis]
MSPSLLDTPLSEIRHALHAHPELSGDERRTAEQVALWLEEAGADSVLRHLGGHGVAGVFWGAAPGPRVMLRAELDALPIREQGERSWRSCHEAVAHSCGHDGHMSALLGVAQQLARRRPARGEVVLLFQPSEETGDGAGRIVDSAAFETIRPDHVYAMHNLPGRPLGEVSVRPGAFSCASRGLVVRLNGLCSHAAHPELGRSPAMAMCRILQGLKRLPLQLPDDHGLVMVTLIHARLGEVAFGTSPGQAEVMATLRTASDDMMRALAEAAVSLVQAEAEEDQLGVEIDWCDVFAATVNAPSAVSVIEMAARQAGESVVRLETAHRWSEDFGVLAASGEGAMFTLGSGEQCPPLHHPAYDFPDVLIERAVTLFTGIVAHHLD